MSFQGRRQQSLGLNNERPVVSMAGLADAPCASQNAIHHDLGALSERNLVICSHGGASILEVVLSPQLCSEAGNLPVEAEHIADYAAFCVEDGDAITPGDGVLGVLLAERLIHRCELRVITTSMVAAYLLAQESSNRVVLTGNELDGARLSTLGNTWLSHKRLSRSQCLSRISVCLEQIDGGGLQKRSIQGFMKQAVDIVFVLVDPGR